jgi:hypothetical protein
LHIITGLVEDVRVQVIARLVKIVSTVNIAMREAESAEFVNNN